MMVHEHPLPFPENVPASQSISAELIINSKAVELFQPKDEVNILRRPSAHLKTFPGGSTWFTKLNSSASSKSLALEDFGGQIPLTLTLNT